MITKARLPQKHNRSLVMNHPPKCMRNSRTRLPTTPVSASTLNMLMIDAGAGIMACSTFRAFGGSVTALLILLRCRLQVCLWLTDQNPLLKLHLGLLQNHRGTGSRNMAGILQRRWICRRCVTSRSVSSAGRSGQLTASIKGPRKKRQYLPWQRWKSKSALAAICAY